VISIYGIKNCDTVRRALDWLERHELRYEFVDLKKHLPEKAVFDCWCEQVGWEVLLNKRSLTWRQLAAEEKADLNQAKAVRLMRRHSSLIKRPVWVVDHAVWVGFQPDELSFRLLSR
jgi:arsenate reductase